MPVKRLNSEQHSWDFLFLDTFTEAQREMFGYRIGIHESAEHAVPQREGGAEILAAINRSRVVDAMVLGSDDEPGERTDFHIQIRMLPKLNEQSEGIADSGLGRAELEEGYGDEHLRDVVNKGMEETGSKPREPVHLFNRMMPCVRSP